MPSFFIHFIFVFYLLVCQISLTFTLSGVSFDIQYKMVCKTFIRQLAKSKSYFKTLSIVNVLFLFYYFELHSKRMLTEYELLVSSIFITSFRRNFNLGVCLLNNLEIIICWIYNIICSMMCDGFWMHFDRYIWSNARTFNIYKFVDQIERESETNIK